MTSTSNDGWAAVTGSARVTIAEAVSNTEQSTAIRWESSIADSFCAGERNYRAGRTCSMEPSRVACNIL